MRAFAGWVEEDLVRVGLVVLVNNMKRSVRMFDSAKGGQQERCAICFVAVVVAVERNLAADSG